MTRYKREVVGKEESSTTKISVISPRNRTSHNMTSPMHSHMTCDEISQRITELYRYDDVGLTPPIPSNDVPHPLALRNSAAYYPLAPSVITTQINYLHNTLFHPNVTGPLSFHSLVLSSKHALRLESDIIHGQQVQRTHAFHASLAELQGPNGIPVSARLGHAIIFFFPSEQISKHENIDKSVDL